jgi:hypothetical protein
MRWQGIQCHLSRYEEYLAAHQTRRLQIVRENIQAYPQIAAGLFMEHSSSRCCLMKAIGSNLNGGFMEVAIFIGSAGPPMLLLPICSRWSPGHGLLPTGPNISMLPTRLRIVDLTRTPRAFAQGEYEIRRISCILYQSSSASQELGCEGLSLRISPSFAGRRLRGLRQ